MKEVLSSDQKMTQVWRQILDLTYPTTAMFSGRAFNGLISEALGERNIEDLWIPYFTLTTDITTSNQRIHTHGEYTCLSSRLLDLSWFSSSLFLFVVFGPARLLTLAHRVCMKSAAKRNCSRTFV